MPYNPFDKGIGEKLQPEDVELLVTREVAEGYYVEYKRQMPKPEKIAKSLASLANTYGGWYIVGVVTNQHNVATQVTGFSPVSCHDPISTVRELVKHHIDPIPVFFPEVVELSDRNLVLLVYVPEGQETPFITRDGRIYRRTHDSSDPVPETSRYALDQLVERGKAPSKRFEEFAKDVRVFSRAETQGWVNLYISPYPFGIVEDFDIMSSSNITALLQLTKSDVNIPLDNPEATITASIPFNTANATPSSVIMRQTETNKEEYNSLSMELDVFGRMKLHIPLPWSQPKDWISSDMQSKATKEKLLDRFFPPHGADGSHLHLFDIGNVWLLITTLINFYLRWLDDKTTHCRFETAIELKEIWRYVAFCDLDDWSEHVSEFGLPILMRGDMRIPSMGGGGYILDATPELWIHLCAQVALAFGLPHEFFAKTIWSVMVNASAKKKSGKCP